MARSRNPQRGDFTRGTPKKSNAGRRSPAEKISKDEKLTAGQKQALTDLELGQRYAGRTFKQYKSPEDKPVVKRRPPMPNESTRTDMDRHGDAG
jgi:hypothetical protein